MFYKNHTMGEGWILTSCYYVQVIIEPTQGKKVEHTGVKIELDGQIGVLSSFSSVAKISHTFALLCLINEGRLGKVEESGCHNSLVVCSFAKLVDHIFNLDIRVICISHIALNSSGYNFLIPLCRNVLWQGQLLWFHLSG